MRKLLALCIALLFIVPAFGYEVIWNGDPDGVITIELQVDCWIEIDWQDTAIEFDGQSDWWEWNLFGTAYQSCPDPDGKFAADPWAGDDWYAPNGLYYESGDGAVIFVRSNNVLEMQVHTNGNLKGTLSPNNELPTWFTIAFCPFMIDDQWIGSHSVPFCGHDGCYASDVNPTNFYLELCEAGQGWPNQYCFPCSPASNSWYLTMNPEVEGTIKFLARVHRHGMADAGDLYTTSIDVHFSTPHTSIP